MLIVCPTCATSYDLGAVSLPPEGRRVRCVRCRAVWVAEPSHADKLLAAAAAIAPDHDAGRGALEAAAQQQPANDVSSQVAADGGGQAAEGRDDLEQAGGGDPAAVAAADAGQTGETAADVDAPSIIPEDSDHGRPPIDVETGRPAARGATRRNIEAVAAGRSPRAARRSMPRWPLSGLQNGILALVLIDAILVGWRTDIVRVLPQTASLYASIGMPVNLRRLTFESIATSMEQHEGVPILVVAGNILNDSRKAAEVPRLKFLVRNTARQEIYSWTAVPPQAVLQAGEAVSFRTRLASPPPDAHDLIVRFITRRDLVPGAH